MTTASANVVNGIRDAAKRFEKAVDRIEAQLVRIGNVLLLIHKDL
jgi:hypothetical protein